MIFHPSCARANSWQILTRAANLALMMNKTMRLLGIFVALATLSSCAFLNQMDSSSNEQLLAAAGFEPRPADTPEKAAALAAMKPYQVNMHTKGGSVYYTYADPKQKLLYVGGPKQYSAYQRLNVSEDIASENEMAAMEQAQANMDWSMWGPGPWGW